ncbi:hypothetical protein [Streptomyces sp. B93]|uniref:hypothetical protein n=1 Tax=Streptomyces sp. B93 TaxID=2824875 RepID=UPI001B362592|nr:hypothetical protein [Streptomyces sp. B93]MBQ1090075.1 hypothetical protein [Streptomyces sp. B93]
MKIKKTTVAGLALVLTLSGGGVAVAASLAQADTSAPTAPQGQTQGADDAPEIGKTGQTADRPGPGVTVHKAEAGVWVG